MTKLKHLVLSAFLALIAIPASAAVVESQEILGQTERALSTQYLEREFVEDILIESGVEPAEAERRVQRMTDEEVAQVYAEFDELPVGQGVSTTNLLLIIIILILIL